MRLTARRRAEILARIQRKLRRRFPIGCRVRLSREGWRALLWHRRFKGRRGTVVSYECGVSPKVLWDGRKTASGYAWEFISRIRVPRATSSAINRQIDLEVMGELQNRRRSR